MGQEDEKFLPRFLENEADRLFFEKGELYAPLRFPIDFIKRHKYRHIFFLRDPRDLLVSAYYSFGYTHALPKHDKQRELFQKQRLHIQNIGIDKFVIKFAGDFLNRFNKYREFRENCDSYLFLSYDEFTSDPYGFLNQINQFLNIEMPNVELKRLSEVASPIQDKIQSNSHKRSGKSGQFRNELKLDTQLVLNTMFSDVLNYWGFEE